MLPVQDGTLLRGPPSLSSKLIMNQSVWNIYACPPLLAWGQLEHPRWPLLSESGKPPCIVISIFLCWSPAEASPTALSTHANLHFCHHVWEMARWPPLLLVPKPTVASLSLFFFLLLLLSFFFFFFKDGKVSWFLACQRRVLWGLHWLSPYHSRKFTACLKKW